MSTSHDSRDGNEATTIADRNAGPGGETARWNCAYDGIQHGREVERERIVAALRASADEFAKDDMARHVVETVADQIERGEI